MQGRGRGEGGEKRNWRMKNKLRKRKIDQNKNQQIKRMMTEVNRSMDGGRFVHLGGVSQRS